MLRVVTINLWDSCTNVNDGLEKLADHIRLLNPDVVALQEIRDAQTVPTLLNNLNFDPENDNWAGHTEFQKLWYPDTGFLYRHPLIADRLDTATLCATGAKIEFPLDNGETKVLTVFSMHTTAQSYGPYAATNRLCTKPEQIHAGEEQDQKSHGYKLSRVHSTKELMTSGSFLDAMNDVEDGEPLILMGDLNTPSHLDWIESTKPSHYGWSFEWPVTKIVESAGLKDAYREVHADPKTHPGITWSPIVKHTSTGEWKCTIPEPQDRLDYVFYAGAMRPVRACTYHGVEEDLSLFPDHEDNEWPSDHSAVVVDFELV